MLDHMIRMPARGESFSGLLHFALAAAFGLMSLHAAVHILARLA